VLKRGDDVRNIELVKKNQERKW